MALAAYDSHPAVADPPRLRHLTVGLFGYGRIGQAVAAVARDERARLAAAGIALDFDRALVRHPARPRSGPLLPLTDDGGAVLGTRPDVIVEVLGGLEPARTLVTRAIESGISVVTANKTLAAHHGWELSELAERRGVGFSYDAAVLAGVPFIGSLARRPLISSAVRIEGVINGTSHYIANAVGAGARFDNALADAQRLGYAEPDSAADVSGRDAAEKLTILLHLAGHRGARVADIACTNLGVIEPVDFEYARRLGGTIKPVALASLDAGAPGAWVGPAFVASAHPFAALTGVANALRLTGASGRDVLFAGPGAGPEATAVTIIDDIVESAGRSFAGSPLWSRAEARAIPLDEPAPGEWFIRTSQPVAGPAFDLPGRLRALNVAVVQSAASSGHAAVRTGSITWGRVADAVASLRADGHRVVAFPALLS